MNWFKRIVFGKTPQPKSPEGIIRYYQGMGFFSGLDPASLVQQYTDDHGKPPGIMKSWDDVFLLAYAKDDVWAEDSEADVCAENEVYTAVLPRWAGISHGVLDLKRIEEHWESEFGPIILRLHLSSRVEIIRPNYLDDWIDLEVLQQINKLITGSGRQFECAVDGNFTLVLCLTPEQKRLLKSERRFPFAW